MTGPRVDLPVIPGPFSFLASAGQAAGAIGSAMTERDRYRQALAAQNAAFLAKLVGMGVSTPESLAGQGAQDLFKQMGAPPLQPDQVEVPAATAFGRRAKSELAKIPEGTAQSQLAAGITTPAQASVDTAKGAEAETLIRGFADMGTAAQVRQFMKLLSPENAEIAERVFLEKSKTELELQDPQRLEGQMQEEIRKSVLKRLPKDAGFRKLADYVAVGALPYLLQEMETSARFRLGANAANTEKIRLVTSITQQATGTYRSAYASWQNGLREARRAGVGVMGSEMEPAELSKRLNEIDQDYIARNPMPTLGDFLDQSLQEGGLTQKDFQETFRSLTNMPTAAPQQSGLQRVIEMYKRGELSDADIDASTKLSAQQKAQIKASKGSAPAGKDRF